MGHLRGFDGDCIGYNGNFTKKNGDMELRFNVI